MCSCSSVQDHCYKTDNRFIVTVLPESFIVSVFLSVHCCLKPGRFLVVVSGFYVIFSSVGAGGGAFKLRYTNLEAAGWSGSVWALLWTAQRGRLFQGAGKLYLYTSHETSSPEMLWESLHYLLWENLHRMHTNRSPLQPSKIKVQFNINQKLWQKYVTIVE